MRHAPSIWLSTAQQIGSSAICRGPNIIAATFTKHWKGAFAALACGIGNEHKTHQIYTKQRWIRVYSCSHLHPATCIPIPIALASICEACDSQSDIPPQPPHSLPAPQERQRDAASVFPIL